MKTPVLVALLTVVQLGVAQIPLNASLCVNESMVNFPNCDFMNTKFSQCGEIDENNQAALVTCVCNQQLFSSVFE